MDAQAGAGVKSEDPADGEESKMLQNIPTAEEAQVAGGAVKQEEDAPAAPTVTFKKRKKVAK
jgi:hypothetical protein